MIRSAINASLLRGLHFCPGQDQPCPGFLLLILLHFRVWVYDEPTMTHKCPWLFCRAAPQCLGYCHRQIRPVFMLQWHGWAGAKVCRMQLVILSDELPWWNLLRYMMCRQSRFFFPLSVDFDSCCKSISCWCKGYPAQIQKRFQSCICYCSNNLAMTRSKKTHH